MKKLLLTLIVTMFTFNCFAYKEHYMLSKDMSPEKVKPLLVLNQKWVKYPSYTDRAGWAKLMKDDASQYIKDGEKYLNYQWIPIKATDYIEYERSGSRDIMQTPNSNNKQALTALFLAELAEGKGRFTDQIINGVYFNCEMTSWVLSAHLVSQPGGTSLPNYKHDYIDLGSGEMGALLSWIYYYLSPEFDKVNPLISERLHHELKKRIIDAYAENDYFWWLAKDFKKGQMVNNWNPWCNSNCLLTYMLIENDPDALAKAVYKSLVSVDKFINYTKEDGACEEGPSYWGHAAGKLYDYLDLIYKLTDGKISIFDEPMIKSMGEYIANTFVNNVWVVNFADASAAGNCNPYLVYGYGEAVNSDVMKGFAKSMYKEEYIKPNDGVNRLFEALQTRAKIETYNKSYKPATCVWYPETEFLYMGDRKGLFFAAKGGFNNESHNHNDAGTFSLYYDATPMLIDIGVGTYTKFTFSNKRYDIFTMQSNYHNLPLINGHSQAFGNQYKATNVNFNADKQTFSLDISKAYKKEANIDSWVRTYALSDDELKIEDKFALSSAKTANQINFISRGEIDITTPGKITIVIKDKKAELSYNSKVFTPTLEEIVLDDKRLSNVWGKKIYRISLDAKTIAPKGTYVYKIKAITNN